MTTEDNQGASTLRASADLPGGRFEFVSDRRRTYDYRYGLGASVTLIGGATGVVVAHVVTESSTDYMVSVPVADASGALDRVTRHLLCEAEIVG